MKSVGVCLLLLSPTPTAAVQMFGFTGSSMRLKNRDKTPSNGGNPIDVPVGSSGVQHPVTNQFIEPSYETTQLQANRKFAEFHQQHSGPTAPPMIHQTPVMQQTVIPEAVPMNRDHAQQLLAQAQAQLQQAQANLALHEGQPQPFQQAPPQFQPLTAAPNAQQSQQWGIDAPLKSTAFDTNENATDIFEGGWETFHRESIFALQKRPSPCTYDVCGGTPREGWRSYDTARLIMQNPKAQGQNEGLVMATFPTEVMARDVVDRAMIGFIVTEFDTQLQAQTGKSKDDHGIDQYLWRWAKMNLELIQRVICMMERILSNPVEEDPIHNPNQVENQIAVAATNVRLQDAAVKWINDEEYKKYTRNCPICMEDIEPDDAAMRCRNEHYFHKKCMRQWFQTCRAQRLGATCPMCRGDVQPHGERLREMLDDPDIRLDERERQYFTVMSNFVDETWNDFKGCFTVENIWQFGLVLGVAGFGFFSGVTMRGFTLADWFFADMFPDHLKIAYLGGWIAGAIVYIAMIFLQDDGY